MSKTHGFGGNSYIFDPWCRRSPNRKPEKRKKHTNLTRFDNRPISSPRFLIGMEKKQKRNESNGIAVSRVSKISATVHHQPVKSLHSKFVRRTPNQRFRHVDVTTMSCAYGQIKETAEFQKCIIRTRSSTTNIFRSEDDEFGRVTRKTTTSRQRRIQQRRFSFLYYLISIRSHDRARARTRVRLVCVRVLCRVQTRHARTRTITRPSATVVTSGDYAAARSDVPNAPTNDYVEPVCRNNNNVIYNYYFSDIVMTEFPRASTAKDFRKIRFRRRRPSGQFFPDDDGRVIFAGSLDGRVQRTTSQVRPSHGHKT